MKAKRLSLAIATVLAAGGLWLARSAWRTHAFQKTSTGADFKTPHDRLNSGQMLRPPGPTSSIGDGVKTPHGQPKPGQMLRPPEPNRRFTDFTPEERVQFARQGHGPGG